MNKQFEKACKEYQKQINKKLDEAKKALSEALRIADEHGIPFKVNIGNNDSYIPSSVYEKFQNIDEDALNMIANVNCWSSYDGQQVSGWTTSRGSC